MLIRAASIVYSDAAGVALQEQVSNGDKLRSFRSEIRNFGSIIRRESADQ